MPIYLKSDHFLWKWVDLLPNTKLFFTTIDPCKDYRIYDLIVNQELAVIKSK